eukprot:jgi/Botrbrau1/3091/Bobra.0070s0077.1
MVTTLSSAVTLHILITLSCTQECNGGGFFGLGGLLCSIVSPFQPFFSPLYSIMLASMPVHVHGHVTICVNDAMYNNTPGLSSRYIELSFVLYAFPGQASTIFVNCIRLTRVIIIHQQKLGRLSGGMEDCVPSTVTLKAVNLWPTLAIQQARFPHARFLEDKEPQACSTRCFRNTLLVHHGIGSHVTGAGRTSPVFLPTLTKEQAADCNRESNTPRIPCGHLLFSHCEKKLKSQIRQNMGNCFSSKHVKESLDDSDTPVHVDPKTESETVTLPSKEIIDEQHVNPKLLESLDVKLHRNSRSASTTTNCATSNMLKRFNISSTYRNLHVLGTVMNRRIKRSYLSRPVPLQGTKKAAQFWKPGTRETEGTPQKEESGDGSGFGAVGASVANENQLIVEDGNAAGFGASGAAGNTVEGETQKGFAADGAAAAISHDLSTDAKEAPGFGAAGI